MQHILGGYHIRLPRGNSVPHGGARMESSRRAGSHSIEELLQPHLSFPAHLSFFLVPLFPEPQEATGKLHPRSELQTMIYALWKLSSLKAWQCCPKVSPWQREESWGVCWQLPASFPVHCPFLCDWFYPPIRQNEWRWHHFPCWRQTGHTVAVMTNLQKPGAPPANLFYGLILQKNSLVGPER